MKITKEQFNKLDQLDRIEFRQRIDLILERYSGGFLGNNYLMGVLILATLLLSVGSLGYIGIGELLFLKLAKSGAVIFCVLFYLLIFELIAYIVKRIYRNKYVKELEEEYFKIEIKKTKKVKRGKK